MVMKKHKLAIAIAIAMMATGCAMMPEATGEVAQAVAKSSSATTAGTVDKIVNNDVNIPVWMVGIAMLAAWFVRTPWGMLSDFIGMRKSRKLLV